MRRCFFCVAGAGLLSLGIVFWLTLWKVKVEPCVEPDEECCTFHCDYWDSDCVEYVSRVEKYCHQSLLTSTEGGEGNITHDTVGLELVHVHIVARHGDRAPVIQYKINPSLSSYNCGLDGNLKWSGLADFRKVPLDRTVMNSYIHLLPSLKYTKCIYGALTHMGYEQQLALGSLMGMKYTDLKSVGPQEIFVHSTDYPRTIHSAAAFLLGFLPDDSHIRKSVAIHISPGSLNNAPPTGIKRTYGNCENFDAIWEEDLEKNGFFSSVRSRFHPFVEKFSDIFHIPRTNHPIITKLFDHLMVRGCHMPYNPLPCNSKGVCIDYTFARQLSTATDWTWAHRYPRKSSLISMLPFLKHSVIDVMERVIKGEKPAYKVLLTFTHDDTITMLLTVLGSPVHEWIPYASRLVFELWRSRTPKPTHYVRVLFNGEPIMDKVPLLSKRTQLEEDDSVIRFHSLQDHLVAGGFTDVKAYNRECGNVS